jgi:tripartite-type tricarboxylate transporter receptor subunit TctC
MNFVSSDSGSLPHLSGELLNLNIKVKVQHIPSQGTSPAMNALLTISVDFLFADTSAFALTEAKKFKLLAITSEKSDPVFPEVLTLSEVFPGFSSQV